MPSANAADAVSIELQGEIEPVCRLTSLSTTIDLGDIGNSGSRQIPLGVDCNTPFSYTVQSFAGGLKASALGSSAPGFISLLPYLVEISVPTDAGLVTGQCQSTALTAENPSCTYQGSSTGIAIRQTGILSLTWATQDELIAGTYSDILTLTVRPRW